MSQLSINSNDFEVTPYHSERTVKGILTVENMTRDNPTKLISKYSHHLVSAIVLQNELPLPSLNNLWCSFMHIIDYDIISSSVPNPIIH